MFEFLKLVPEFNIGTHGQTWRCKYGLSIHGKIEQCDAMHRHHQTGQINPRQYGADVQNTGAPLSFDSLLAISHVSSGPFSIRLWSLLWIKKMQFAFLFVGIKPFPD